MTWERAVLLGVVVVTILSPALMWLMPDQRCPAEKLCGTFRPVGGNAYVYATILPGSKPDDGNGRNSTVELYEDGKLLGPAHRDVQEIKDLGAGRFLYWQSSMKIGLFLSASDNSDPNTNGRSYTVKDPSAFDPYK